MHWLKIIFRATIAFWCCIGFIQFSHAENTVFPDSAVGLRVYLDQINFDYKDREKERLVLLKSLIEHTDMLLKEKPNDPGLETMAGFFNAQYAGFKGGIGALKYAKEARRHLEKSVKLDPQLYQAAAHTILGSLYYRVPGWPVGFGNKKKAEQNYKKAVEIAPQGIDANFTYAQFLFREKRYNEAKTFLLLAQKATPRPERPRADKHLQERIVKRLGEVEEQLVKEKK